MPIIRKSDCVPLPIVVCPVVAVVMLESRVARCVHCAGDVARPTRCNKILIYWQSVVSQHVSGIFVPIIRRSDCVPLPMVVCPVVAVVMLESGVCKMCALCGECCMPEASNANAQIRPDRNDHCKLCSCCIRNTHHPLYLYFPKLFSVTSVLF